MLWNFFFFLSSISVSMESILQSLVKIIIIGSFYKTILLVDCNRQFLPPPPLPYYPNGEFIIQSFPHPYHEPLPVYYREENPPPPISYQNMNSFPPPQLFHQNQNYNPLQFAAPTTRYSLPQTFPYKPTFNLAYRAQPNLNVGLPQANFQTPSQVPVESQNRPAEATQKKPAFFATNVIIKEDNTPSYYNDDFNKNYHDDDYNDSYSDDSASSKPDPCVLNSPYRYFEPPKPDPNNPKPEDKYTLCNPNFHPNLGSNIYTVKMPITLLPSRFPPRVEQLIERIQNYFSTYTHQETLKPLNETSTTTAIHPVTEAVNESDAQTIATTENLIKKNTTEENQEQNVEQTNLNPTEAVTVGGGNETEEVTQKTIVAIIQEEEKPPASSPDDQNKKESQVVVEVIHPQTPTPITEAVPTATETFVAPQGELPVSEQQPVRAQKPQPSTGNQTAEIEIHLIEEKKLETTTETSEMKNRTEQIITSKDESLQYNVTDSYG